MVNEDEDFPPLADIALTPAAEHEWTLLRELVDFADRLVVAFIFADRFPVRVLRDRMQREARAKDLPFRLVIGDAAEALRNDALAAVLAPEAEHEVTWFEAFGPEEALGEAWFFAAQRWNEHREPLRRSSLRALIVAAPVWAKKIIRLAAPDLWSITNLVIEPAALPSPDTGTDLPAADLYPQGALAEQVLSKAVAAEARELPPGGRRTRALIEALSGAVRAGDWPTAESLAAGYGGSSALHAQLKKDLGDDEKPVLELARSLRNLGVHFGGLARQNDALNIVMTASGFYRELLASQPAEASRGLALSLSYAALQLHGLERLGEAADAAQEAVEIYRNLAPSGSHDLGPELARSLVVLGICKAELGRLSEALAAAEEATQIYRDLAATDSNFLPDLATSLNFQANYLLNLGSTEKALALVQEIASFGQELQDTQPSMLATNFVNLGNVLGRLGRHEEALAAAEAGVAIIVGLARSRPEEYLQNLKHARRNLIARLEQARMSLDSSPALRDAEELLSAVEPATLE